LRRGGNGNALEAAGGTRIALPANVPGNDGQQVTLGTRPEHLAIGNGGDGIAGSILVVEPTGAETQIVVEAAQQQVVAVFSERHHFEPGAKITLTPRPEALHLFDTASGRHLGAH